MWIYTVRLWTRHWNICLDLKIWYKIEKYIVEMISNHYNHYYTFNVCMCECGRAKGLLVGKKMGWPLPRYYFLSKNK